jgi:hypothetical protein
VSLSSWPPSTVVGDGQATLRELVEAKRNVKGENDWRLIEALAGYCGITSIDDVLEAGKEVLIEFRYGSRYDEPERHNTNTLQPYRHQDLGAQFARASASFARGISPNPELAQSLYTLDAGRRRGRQGVVPGDELLSAGASGGLRRDLAGAVWAADRTCCTSAGAAALR